MAATNVNGAISRIENKLKCSIDSGNFYEAHQLYRTLYFRYCAQSKFEPLLQMLYDGAICLFNAAQHASAIDLAILYVDVLVKSKACVIFIAFRLQIDIYLSIRLFQVEPGILQKMEKMFQAMPVGNKDESILKERFDQDASKWSSQQNHSHGHPLLHNKFGHVLWRQKDYAAARRHFMFAEDGEVSFINFKIRNFGFKVQSFQVLANFLIDYQMSCGNTEECDLFIAQAVLQLLRRRQISVAQTAFENYVARHPQIKSIGM